MQLKSDHPQADLSESKIVFHSQELTIYTEANNEVTTYNPKKTADISKLCEVANIEEVIIESKEKKYPDLLVFESIRYNLGIIANESIKKNKIICEYLGEVASLEKAVNRNRVKKILENDKLSSRKYSSESLDKAINSYIKRISDYAFEITAVSSNQDTVLAHNKRSLAAFINHNTTDSNVIADIVDNVIYYKASRHINKGEQLIIDYGPDYDYQDRLYYIPSTENHLGPALFLTDNIEYYYKKPVKITAIQKEILGIQVDFVMLPKYLYRLLKAKKPRAWPKLTEYEKRLPVFELAECTEKDGHIDAYDIHVPHLQHNISALMFACATQNPYAINILIKIHKIDIFAKTIHDIDALIMAINASDSEPVFIKLAKPIIKKSLSNIDRTDALGSDNFEKTGLHMLVELEWCKAIALFDNKIFFDVIDADGYDPLISAIARGKTNALNVLLKIACVKKYMYDLLLAEDETKNNLVLKRALKDTPRDNLDEIVNLLRQATNRRKRLKKSLSKILGRK